MPCEVIRLRNELHSAPTCAVNSPFSRLENPSPPNLTGTSGHSAPLRPNCRTRSIGITPRRSHSSARSPTTSVTSARSSSLTLQPRYQHGHRADRAEVVDHEVIAGDLDVEGA